MTDRFSLSVLPLLLFFATAGCNDDGSGSTDTSPTAAPPPTTAELIAIAESRGELPKLDRSATLNGTDGDGNGVRDDLDSYVAGLSVSTPQKASLLQQAKAVQQAINASPADRAAMDAARLAEARAIHCVYLRFPPTDATSASSMSETMETLSLNTSARITAYIAYGAASDGIVLPSPEGNSCE